MYSGLLFGCFGIFVLSLSMLRNIIKNPEHEFIEFMICWGSMIASLFGGILTLIHMITS